MIDNSVYILSVDAKDIYIANNSDSSVGYNIRYPDGEINTNKFINSLDYSLDLIQLRDVYKKVYRNNKFSFFRGDKEFTQSVINVTFKYSNKEYNKIYDNTYVKFGVPYTDITLSDCVYTINGEAVAVKVGEEVENPVPQSCLGDQFQYNDDTHTYEVTDKPETLDTVADLRLKLYEDGFMCDGIKYVRFKRSSGSSRVGKCLFIDERLYQRMHKWEMCGLKVNEGQDIDLAGLESYISLTLSSIIDTIEIEPKNILVIDDYESTFKDKVVSTELGEDGWLTSEEKYIDVSNSIWDGQSLMDESLFGKYNSYGFLLLRNRFFKSACFNCNIQQWFTDNNITSVDQLNGYTVAENISDIKLITTPSSIKYLKFGDLDTWLEKIDSTFGVVKHEKPPKGLRGRMVQIHYQLINTLQLSRDDIDELLEPSFDYVEKLYSDPDVLRYHIRYPDERKFLHQPLYSTNDVVYNLLGLNKAFSKTKLYDNFRVDLVKSFIKNMKKGHIFVDGNYSTLLGNGIEMLQSAIGQFDGESIIGVGNIHSTRFEYGKDILGTRSPHVTMGNILVTHNVESEVVDRYFNLTNEIVYVNSINENLLNRLSGSDFDSDTILLTDNKVLLRAAKTNYSVFSVPTSDVEAKKIKRQYTAQQKADLDIKTSVNKIGEIVNLSQILNSIYWDSINHGATFDDMKDLYYEISKLDVMSNIEIDKAKREYPIDSATEIKRIRQKFLESDDNKKVIPYFFSVIERDKGYYDTKRKKYLKHETAMDYMQQAIEVRAKDIWDRDRVYKYNYTPSDTSYTITCAQYESKRVAANYIRAELCDQVECDNELIPTAYEIAKDMKRVRKEYEPFHSIINFKGYDSKSVYYPSARDIINKVRQTKTEIRMVWNSESLERSEKYLKCRDKRNDCMEFVNSKRIGRSTMCWLLKAVEDEENSDICRMLITMLFSSPNKEFYELINGSYEKCSVVAPASSENDTSLYLFGHKYKKV